MKALIAFDKFKDALSAKEICDVVVETLSKTQPDWILATAPLADGGDGFCDTLTQLANGTFHSASVSGPLGQETSATYGMVSLANVCDSAKAALDFPADTKQLAIVELAQSSGIALIPSNQRSPWTTSTFGLGETIQHAIDSGADAVLVGLGGSSSNDLGLGALQALGYTFLDSSRRSIATTPTPENWGQIESIVAPSNPNSVPIRIACDVENPLTGPNGAAAIFGPQKGLKPEDFDSLDFQSKTMAELLCKCCDISLDSLDTSGAGAAGGTAFGLMVGLGGIILSGAKLVFAWSNLEHELADSDIVITGEGRFDKSSLQGKGPGSLAIKAANIGKQVHVLAGSIGEFDAPLHSNISLAAISPPGIPIAEAIASTEKNLRATVSATFA